MQPARIYRQAQFSDRESHREVMTYNHRIFCRLCFVWYIR